MRGKKWIVLALALALLLGAAACSGGAVDDWEAIEKSGKLKIGFTYFAPMNYLDENGDFVGFETEFAKAVCEKLGVSADFVEINWDAKTMELESRNIDCIWNGMTITPKLTETLTISEPYIKNYQVVVIRSDRAEEFRSTADLVGAKLEAEAGSAGAAAVEEDENLSKATLNTVPKQTDALLEVKTGAADACVLDFVLANAMVGQGDYSDLTVIPDLRLSVEEYGIGFRKGSSLCAKVNEAVAALTEDGTLNTIAEKYDLDELLLANQK